ncbi:hypothetical protein [Microbacterium sp. APC 3901]|uniref:hypothetical protein n=1 Tax=Microbacterium sp. APC 3901 TaxID=3035192 RepID=UPI0025B2E25E|nr:hypothetical protein [Microbacterium sp. APC 3901]MDN3443401.1 hypothetical protein [Microbacterium sp. APC 3901]
MSEFTDALRALNDDEDKWHARDRQIREERGVPDDVPLVTRDSDSELMQHMAELQELNRRWAEFNATHAGADDEAS